jgi:predicted glycosyltransferase
MRIFIDIGHPAHVHYFKNFIRIMESHGHIFFVSARNRSIIFSLLKTYNIPYYDRGKGKDGVLGKLFYMIGADFKLFSKARKFNPHIFISFASPYAAQTAWLLRKPHIVLDDTEHARFGHFFYKPFSKTFLNPACFQKDFGINQIRFNSYTELFYLHPHYFTSQSAILSTLGVSKNEKFVLLRFVSWQASHDLGHSGLDLSTKKELVILLNNNSYKVLISSEGEITDPFFEEYLIKISPELIHQVMAHATLLITEGATMASECAMLGTPAIYVNSLDAGTLREQEDKYQLIHGFRSSEGVLTKVVELLNLPNLKEIYQLRRQKLLSEKIDVTAFAVWFVENYPESVRIMKENPEYQERFK